MKEFDLIVVGAGSAGMKVVHDTSAQGWNVALIESSHLGGTCINIGCIPSKALLYSAGVMHAVRNAEKYGVLTEPPTADWPAMVSRKNELVGRIRGRSYKNIEKNENVELFEGEAVFQGPHQISVNGEIVYAPKIVIAAGARTAVPSIAGLDKIDYLTSTSIMEMERLPESMLVLGGGIIALEFSQLMTRLGVRVTIIQRNKRLAPVLEPEISAEIGELLGSEGVEIKTGAQVSAAGKDKGLVYLLDGAESNAKRYSAEKLLVATGRAPNSDRLKVQNAGVETDEKGFIKVDSSFKTTANGVWAIGDIIGGPMFTHRAWHDGMLLSNHLVGDKEISNRGRLIPFTIFTEPEIAGVGLGEQQAVEAGYKYKVQRYPFAFQGRALAVLKTDGFVKLVVEKDTGKILGAHIIGPEAGELIHELIAAIRFGATIYDLQDMMHVHPTLAETINNAAWSE